MIHCLDTSNLRLQCVNRVLQSVLEALRHLLVRRNEEFIDLDGYERGASGILHRGRELLEDVAVHNLRVVRLEHLVTLDLDQVVE